MKKLFYILTILVLSLIITPTIFAKDGVAIESYELVDNSKTTTELSPPKINGLNISFDLGFVKVNDYAKYKIVVNNPTDNEYEISKDSDFNISNYITYKYEFEENDRIVPAKSKTTLFITITYSKMVPNEKLSNNKYVEDNNMAISLSTDMSSISKEEKNPNTASGLLLLCVLALSIVFLSLLLFGKTKKKKYFATMIMALVLIPTTIFALEKLQIKVETKITIEKKYKLSYRYGSAIKESEKDNYTFGKLYEDKLCDDYTYIINGERYINCTISIDSYHTPGERVTTRGVQFTRIRLTKIVNSIAIPICSETGENEYTCEEEAISHGGYDYMIYGRYFNPASQDNDLTIMNIKKIEIDEWEQWGNVEFINPNEFTMPDHDVILAMDDGIR
jgi:hypothetical protein